MLEIVTLRTIEGQQIQLFKKIQQCIKTCVQVIALTKWGFTAQLECYRRTRLALFLKIHMRTNKKTDVLFRVIDNLKCTL